MAKGQPAQPLLVTVARAGLGTDQNLAAAKRRAGRTARSAGTFKVPAAVWMSVLVRHSARQGHNRLTFRPIPSVCPGWRPTGSYAEQGRYAGLRAP
jgi:hypothetical protein